MPAGTMRLAMELGLHLQELRARFLPDDKLRELNEPENFQKDFDARAFLVLAHSAFEQFFEDVCADFAAKVIDHWNRGALPSKQLVITVACLSSALGDFGRALAPTKDEGGTGVLGEPRAKLTTALRDANAAHQSLLEKNHGTDLAYLRSLFVPLGIYLTPPPDAASALTHIANARGTFAHRRTVLSQGRFAYQPISADKALDATEGLFHWCIEFERELSVSLSPSYVELLTLAKRELITTFLMQLALLTRLKANG